MRKHKCNRNVGFALMIEKNKFFQGVYIGELVFAIKYLFFLTSLGL